MLTEKDYCDYSTNLSLWQLGCKFNPHYTKLTLYEAQKFIRDEKKLHITIFSSSQESWMYRITKQHQKLEDSFYEEDLPTYEDALLQAIRKCVKICEQNVN